MARNSFYILFECLYCEWHRKEDSEKEKGIYGATSYVQYILSTFMSSTVLVLTNPPSGQLLWFMLIDGKTDRESMVK